MQSEAKTQLSAITAWYVHNRPIPAYPLSLCCCTYLYLRFPREFVLELYVRRHSGLDWTETKYIWWTAWNGLKKKERDLMDWTGLGYGFS